MEAFAVAIGAVTPFLVYLSLGALMRKSGLVRESFLLELNQMLFLCFFPITMFANTHALAVDVSQCLPLLLLCAGLLAAVIAVSLVVVPRLEPVDARRGVIIQCLNRSNLVLYALGMTETLFGAPGVALASVVVAIFVPIYNVAAIIVLEYYRGGTNSLPALVRKVATNPLLVGGVTGIVFSLLGIHLPAVLEDTVSKLSGVTTPMAMIVLGGTLHASGVARNLRAIVATLATKMMVIPAVAVAACVLLGLPPLETFVCFIMFGAPVAASVQTRKNQRLFPSRSRHAVRDS